MILEAAIGVHLQRARPLAEAHALRAEPAAVAGLAKELPLVLGAVGRVQHFVASAWKFNDKSFQNLNVLNLLLLHLKQALCHLWPPAIFSSAAYTDLVHLGHLGASELALNGILASLTKLWNK